ncbi:hypothetical protein T06_468 [Trichinella sp. T6]|nr:hypothetical protein T06_468 [Trichinella sp. T6]
MSKIRQDRRSQQSTEKPLSSKQSTEQSNNIDYDAFRLIPYQHIVHIYAHSVEKNLPLNIVKLLLNFLSNKVMESHNCNSTYRYILFLKGEEVNYEGRLVENKRIEIKPQLRLKLTRSVKSDERAKLLGSLAAQMKKRDNDSTAQLLPPPFFSSDASNFFVIVHKVTE